MYIERELKSPFPDFNSILINSHLSPSQTLAFARPGFARLQSTWASGSWMGLFMDHIGELSTAEEDPSCVLTIRVVWISCCDETGPRAGHVDAQETVLDWRRRAQVCRRKVIR
jgi:hypothetical protein